MCFPPCIFVYHFVHSFVFLILVGQHTCVTVVPSGWELCGARRRAALWPRFPDLRFTVARLPPILANASGHRAGKYVCRHACMRSRFWITDSSWVLLPDINNHRNLTAVSPGLNLLTSKKRHQDYSEIFTTWTNEGGCKITLCEITIKSQLGAQQEGIRPPLN